MTAMIAMTALSVFANSQIVNKREGAQRADTVGIGDPFEAPWHVARDLAQGRLAEALDEAALDQEPTEAVDPHPALSVADVARINARRKVRPVGQTAAAAGQPAAITGDQFALGPSTTALDPSKPASEFASGAGSPATQTGLVSTSGAKSNAPAIPPAADVSKP